jgi:hypothetical protein
MYMSLQPYFLHDTLCTHYTTDDGPTRAETHLVMVWTIVNFPPGTGFSRHQESDSGTHHVFSAICIGG